MIDARKYILYSGGANGAEAHFGACAEKYGVQEVNYSFEGHQIVRNRGVRVLTSEELELKDVSMSYVSRLMHRAYSQAPLFRKVLQSICWQVSSGHEIFVVGSILEDQTVKGGTGWGAEFAKLCNKPLYVFDQDKETWHAWNKEAWEEISTPTIGHHHFCGTGTRFLNDAGRKAVDDLFARSFG